MKRQKANTIVKRVININDEDEGRKARVIKKKRKRRSLIFLSLCFNIKISFEAERKKNVKKK